MTDIERTPSSYADFLQELSDSIVITNKEEGIPYIEFNNKEAITYAGKTIPKGRSVLFADGTILPASELSKQKSYGYEYRKAEIGTTMADKYASKVISAQSPNFSKLRDKLIESNIPFSLSSYQNKRTNQIVYKFTANVKFLPKIKDLENETKKENRGVQYKIEKSLDSDKFELLGNAFYIRNPYTNKYIEEHCKAPDELIDRKKQAIAKINESIIKCEVYLGQLREAHINNDIKEFENAKEKLYNEFKELKEFEKKELLQDHHDIGIYSKMIDLHTMKMIETAIQEIETTNMKPLEKLEEKLKQHKQENGYIQHLKCLADLAAHGAFSLQEAMDFLTNLYSNHTIEGYGNATRLAYSAGLGIGAGDEEVSKAKDAVKINEGKFTNGDFRDDKETFNTDKFFESEPKPLSSEEIDEARRECYGEDVDEHEERKLSFV